MEITPAELAAALAATPPLLIDCREPDEYAICRLPGSLLLPLSQWAQSYPDGFPARDREVVVYCHHGMRSLRAVHFLHQRGHHHARSLAGGIDVWSQLIDPGIPRY